MTSNTVLWEWDAGWHRYQSLPYVACLPGHIYMSSLVDRWNCSILVALTEIYRLELKCVPLEDLFRTNTGVKSIQVRSVKEPDITDL